MPWTEEKKAMVEVVIKSPTYTSSDESDFSEDENGESHLAGYLVKKVSLGKVSTDESQESA